MASSPSFKVYRDGEYVAACKYAEDAAMFVATAGGDEVRYYNHRRVLWREGAEAFQASESYDEAAAIMRKRLANPSTLPAPALEDRVNDKLQELAKSLQRRSTRHAD